MPASTMKVVTLAVAAERLGWDARFTTRLETTGSIEDGVLRGDLIVTGDGDPTIGEREDTPRVLDEWAGRLAMLGVTRIDGRLIGDDDVLPDQALGAGWAWDDLAFGFAAPIGALQFHEGSAQVVITAGPRPDTPASMRLEPASTDLVLTGQVTTTGPDTPPAVFTRRRPFSRTLEVTGSVPRTDRDYVRTVSTDNPTRGLLLAFRDALGRFGIARERRRRGHRRDRREARRAAPPAAPPRIAAAARDRDSADEGEPEPDRRDAARADRPGLRRARRRSAGRRQRRLRADAGDLGRAGRGRDRRRRVRPVALRLPHRRCPGHGAAPHGAGSAPRRRVRGDAADPRRRRHPGAPAARHARRRAASAPRPAACRTSARWPAT